MPQNSKVAFTDFDQCKWEMGYIIMTTSIHSESLDLPIKHDSETGIVTVKDLVYKTNRYVEYSHDEQKIFNIFDIDKTVHSVKKIFDGEIVNKKYNHTNPVLTDTGIKEPGQFDLF